MSLADAAGESVRSSSLHSLKRGKAQMKKIQIARLPELKTSVALQGSIKHKEVGGPVCLGALLGVAFIVVAA